MARSNFIYTINGKILYIVDSNQGGMSVTNDAENVIKELNSLLNDMGETIDSFDVIYKDSDGRIDGMTTSGNKFQDFYLIGESDYELAKTKIKPRL